MDCNIVVVGSGFAGTWAALAAARAIGLAGRQEQVRVTVVSPSPHMVIRPRLYEAVLENMNPDLAPLFATLGIHHVAGQVTAIDAKKHQVTVSTGSGPSILAYTKLVLAAGSRLFMPPIPGLSEHGFNVDQLEDAKALGAHLQSLTVLPESPARNTVIVVGAGLTGIETAAEMPSRLSALFGAEASVRVLLLEQAPVIGPDLGAAPRPVIEAALAECGVEILTQSAIAAIDQNGVSLACGKRYEAKTVVWAAGARAHPLAEKIAGQKDKLGRVFADAYLHADGGADIFVAGDVAHAATDDLGHVALMSCQHALSLGRVAGHNAAAELLGLPLHPYSQPKYVTCLDIGSWGALYTEGWDQQIRLIRDEAKALKRQITTQWIYPPAPEREAALATANPDFVIVP